MPSTMTLRQVADDLGISYESARQLACGSLGDPLPALRTSAMKGARWLVPTEAFREWQERQLKAQAERGSFAGLRRGTDEQIWREGLENLSRRREIALEQRAKARAEREAAEAERRARRRRG